MTEREPVRISSRDNPLVKDLKRLAQDSGAYRRQGRVWVEGDHLCRAALARGLRPALGVFSEYFWPLASADIAHAAIKNIVLDDVLMATVSGLESPAPMAASISATSTGVSKVAVAASSSQVARASAVFSQ